MEAGSMAFLTGHSGAGKSTLLKLIALLERTTRGQLFLDGENLPLDHGDLRNKLPVENSIKCVKP